MTADLSSMAHTIALTSGGLLLFGAGLHDVAARTVPNLVCTCIAAFGLIVRFLEHDVLVGLAVALVVFFLAALCWRRGWMGGGDVKLLGAAALLVRPGSAATLVVDVALAGGILAVTYLILYATMPRRVMFTPKPRSVPARALRVERWRIARKGPIPYASAIAAGALFCLLGE
jgi:prepilin peptidase CpaA